MGEELREFDLEMLEDAGELDPESVELSDEQLEEIAGGDDQHSTRRQVLHKRCPKCGHSPVAKYFVDGKPSYIICPNCNFRHDLYW